MKIFQSLACNKVKGRAVVIPLKLTLIKEEPHNTIFKEEHIIDDVICCNTKKKICRHSTKEPHVCNICKKLFFHKSCWEKHSKFHNRKKYECNICQETFSNKKVLKKHSVLHAKFKPYLCNFCNTSLSTIDELRQHVIIHREEKSRVCVICQKSLIEKGYLRYSIDGKQHACESCFKKVPTSLRLGRKYVMNSKEDCSISDLINSGCISTSNQTYNTQTNSFHINTTQISIPQTDSSQTNIAQTRNTPTNTTQTNIAQTNNTQTNISHTSSTQTNSTEIREDTYVDIFKEGHDIDYENVIGHDFKREVSTDSKNGWLCDNIKDTENFEDGNL